MNRKLCCAALIALVTGFAAQSEEDTPVLFKDLTGPLRAEQRLPWVPPNYSGQDSALGYGTAAFAVPTGLEERVNFWIDIYTKFNTDQGLLHDSKYVHITYEPVDFTDIMRDASLDAYQKEKARKKRVDAQKKAIRERLKRLERLSSPAGLEGEDLRYWYMFAKVDDKNKFIEASKEGRLRFQLGQKDRFIQGIYQSGKFIRQMEQIFKEEGLPIELVRMVFVESSFNLRARSKVGASGIWQFMRGTARQYMKLDYSVDERNDPLIATRAAARKLRDNYKMLESWPLAVTGYNHGPYGVRRLVERAGTKDIVELTDVRKGSFGFASASFYASFLAAIEVEKNAPKYLGDVYMAAPLEGEEIRLTKSLHRDKILEWFDGDLEKAQEFNPSFASMVWEGKRLLDKGHLLRVPKDLKAKVEQDLKTYKVPPHVIAASGTHQVRRGETLSEIAERYKVRLSHLIEINGIENPRGLRSGQVLQIPH